MPRHIKNLEALPEFPPTVLDGVKRILQLVRPEKENIERCRRDVMDGIRMIASMPPYVPPSVLKRQLSKVTAEMKAARKAINELPSGWRGLLDADIFLNELARVIQKSEELASCIRVKKRGGGDPRKRTAAFQKNFAAGQAFDLLNDWGGRTPTLTKDGEYYRLTEMLMKIATERKSAGDVERACARVLKKCSA